MLGEKCAGMALVCFIEVQAFVWHILPPVFLSMSPPHRVLMLGGERNSICLLELHLLVMFELVRDPLSLGSEWGYLESKAKYATPIESLSSAMICLWGAIGA